ncbi:hypothetical protein KKA13_03420 [Patescibacteria group bacterium]|nr:hypothetical protein [Patescibacteria group bacterium]MBU1613183.1 hypothetical protein [Patescibacteria group bacterium]
MFFSPKLYLRDLWISIPLAGAVTAQIFMWTYILYYIHPSPDQFFLHYNITFGVDLAGEWWKILLLPISGLAVFLINYFLSFYFYGVEKFLSRLLVLIAGIFHVFLVIATVLIVGLNS